MDAALAAMILSGARVALGPTLARRLDVRIRGGRINGLDRPGLRGLAGTRSLTVAVRDRVSITNQEMDVGGCLILPGLINAHDHLSFNLFPLLGRPPYPNATAWARDIYRPEESPVLEHRSVPRDVRLAWGGIKNLISGVTMVAHHDPDSPREFGRRFPVRVATAGWAHSLAFTPDIVARHRRNGDRPFVMHLGEATDAEGAEEIFEIDRMGALDERTVIVHGVGLDAAGWRLLRRKRGSVVACPVSNLFTLGRTLKRSAFSSGVSIALGTDSALTAPGDLLDALRAARSVWKLSAARLYRMVTCDAAKVLRLRDGEGEIRMGGVADLVVIRDARSSPAEALLDLRRLEMVIVGGRVRMVSERLARFAGEGFQMMTVEGRGRVLVDADVGKLYDETVERLGTGFKLAGRWMRIRRNR